MLSFEKIPVDLARPKGLKGFDELFRADCTRWMACRSEAEDDGTTWRRLFCTGSKSRMGGSDGQSLRIFVPERSKSWSPEVSERRFWSAVAEITVDGFLESASSSGIY